MRETYSAGGVVIGPAGKILVVNQNGNSWSLPKGHLDPGENERQAAEREIYEEAGISQLQFVKDLASYQRSRIGKNGGEDATELKNIQMFLFTTKESKLQPIDRTHPQARWVVPTRVADLLTHPKDKLFYQSVLAEVERYIAEKVRHD